MEMPKDITPKAWFFSLAATVIFLGIAWLVMPDFVNLDSKPSLAELGIIVVVAFFFPALCEEIVFRVFLNRSQSPVSIAVSTLAFVAWHPIGAYLFLKEAIPWFLDPRFLIFVAIFGVMSCLMRKFSRSIWPSIVSHWIVVIVWKGLGGTQFLT